MVDGLYITIARSDGEGLTIDGYNYFVDGDEGLEGIDFADWSLYSEQLAFRDGSVVTGSSYAGRPFSITFYATSKDNTLREKLRSLFNPKDTFDIYITYKNVTRWISGYIESLEVPTQTPYEINKVKVGFFCEDPFFKSVSKEAKDLNEITPRWGFPFIATADYDPVMSVFESSTYVWFDNDGDVEVPFKVSISFVTSTTGLKIVQGYSEKVFEFNHSFVAGDLLEIDFDKATVELNGSNAWSYVKSNSELLSIPRGGTYLSATATTGQSLLHTKIQYNKKYGGI